MLEILFPNIHSVSLAEEAFLADLSGQETR